MREAGRNGAKSIYRTARCLAAAAALSVGAPLFAGFASTETFLPAVGRIPGKFGAQFYTTIWATNLTGSTVHFTFDFLKQGQANTSPASFADTLAPGETKTYENVVETKLGENNALGAARVVSDGEILVSERIYDQAPGDDLGKTVGLFFAGVPKGFSISLGQSSSIQGIDQGGAENFRYNFALVETGGASATVHVALYDASGASLGSKDYILQPYEQIQPNVDDLKANLATTNARITATVTAGAGSVLLAGAQLANESQDSSGFEMSFRDDLLGGGGGGGGLSAVSHDGTLVGNGTGGSPLGINPAAVVTSVNGLHGAVTLSAGSNVTITPSGQNLTIAATGGGGGGLTLPFSGSIASDQIAFMVQNTGIGPAMDAVANKVAMRIFGDGATLALLNDSAFQVYSSTAGAIYASTSKGDGVAGSSENGAGLVGTSSGGDGVYGSASANAFSGIYGLHSGAGYGVFGQSNGTTSSAVGVGGNAPNGGAAAHFYTGNVRIDNDLHVTGKIFAGTKDFEIDDPLDPANAFLVHASVESSEMLNVYTGNVRLDVRGEAVVRLPAWFESENGDFRYQLTAIGAPARDLYVAREIENGEFQIAGGVAGGKVSWQVAAVRRDPWALAHPLVVEGPKPERERGFYLHPELYGAPPERQMDWADEPEAMKAMRDRTSGPPRS